MKSFKHMKHVPCIVLIEELQPVEIQCDLPCRCALNKTF